MGPAVICLALSSSPTCCLLHRPHSEPCSVALVAKQFCTVHQALLALGWLLLLFLGLLCRRCLRLSASSFSGISLSALLDGFFGSGLSHKSFVSKSCSSSASGSGMVASSFSGTSLSALLHCFFGSGLSHKSSVAKRAWNWLSSKE